MTQKSSAPSPLPAAKTVLAPKADMKITLVLNTDYGGFSLDTEMAEWLRDNRGWSLLNHEFDGRCTDGTLKKALSRIMSNIYYHPEQHSIEFRSNQDLIDCVRELREKRANSTFNEWHYSHIKCLEVVEANVNFSVNNYHDGKERLEIGYTISEED